MIRKLSEFLHKLCRILEIVIFFVEKQMLKKFNYKNIILNRCTYMGYKTITKVPTITMEELEKAWDKGSVQNSLCPVPGKSFYEVLH